jgi:chemotaxis protein histidine kinase CheA
VISLVRLADALRIAECGVPSAESPQPGTDNREPGTGASPIRNPPSEIRNRLYVLVVALGDQRIGLAVDGLQGEGELVIKALDADWMRRAPIAGASVLGDGRVVLIVDPAALVDQVQQRARANAERGMRNAEPPPPGTGHREPGTGPPSFRNPQSAIRNGVAGARR